MRLSTVVLYSMHDISFLAASLRYTLPPLCAGILPDYRRQQSAVGSAMARSRRSRLACLTLSNLLMPIAVVVFASGFFPYKPLLPGLATFEDVSDGSNAQAEAAFDRVIFMVVDALRSDFVYGFNSGFEFTQRYVCTRLLLQ